MAGDRAHSNGFVGRFLGSWELALGELVIVALGVLLALWADQWMQSREEAGRAIGYLQRLRADVEADIRSLQFSADQARNRLAITRTVDGWLSDPAANPDPDLLALNVHFAGVTFPPAISRFTIEELKSTGDLRLLENPSLKRQIADYYNQVDLQLGQWANWGDMGLTETYFRELAFVMDPEIRLRVGTFDPALMQQFIKSAGGGPTRYTDAQGNAQAIGATPADAQQLLQRMRERPNFAGYLRDSMYWAHLSAQLMDGLILSAEELSVAIDRELETLDR